MLKANKMEIIESSKKMERCFKSWSKSNTELSKGFIYVKKGRGNGIISPQLLVSRTPRRFNQDVIPGTHAFIQMRSKTDQTPLNGGQYEILEAVSSPVKQNPTLPSNESNNGTAESLFCLRGGGAGALRDLEVISCLCSCQPPHFTASSSVSLLEQESDELSQFFKEPATTALPTTALDSPKGQAAAAADDFSEASVDALMSVKAPSAEMPPTKDGEAKPKFGAAGSKSPNTVPEVQAMYKVKLF
jgi:hypothetical protein